MVETLPSSRGVLRVVSPQGLTDAVNARDTAFAQQRAGEGNQEQVVTELARYIRSQFETMRNHRSSGYGWNERLLKAQRVFNGEYEASKLAEIRKFGGSEV